MRIRTMQSRRRYVCVDNKYIFMCAALQQPTPNIFADLKAYRAKRTNCIVIFLFFKICNQKKGLSVLRAASCELRQRLVWCKNRRFSICLCRARSSFFVGLLSSGGNNFCVRILSVRLHAAPVYLSANCKIENVIKDAARIWFMFVYGCARAGGEFFVHLRNLTKCINHNL